jgi:hypothetical protein
MIKKITDLFTKLSILVCMPLITGCGGSGGGGGVGSLFSTSNLTEITKIASSDGSTGGSQGFEAVFSLASVGSTDAAITTVHNPEPATMLLLSSGIVAMAFMKKKRTN